LPLLILAALLVVLWPRNGVDFAQLPHLKLLVAGAFAVLLLLKSSGAGWLDTRRYRVALAGLAAASVVVYVNFLAFHGAHVFVHAHDVANYYLGSKYFGELGHAGLYTAILRAEAEGADRLWTTEARDLARNEVVGARELLAKSEEVKAQFTPERWAEFRRDVLVFRSALGPDHWPTFLNDHGYNATPLWTLIGGTIASHVRLEDGHGLLLLSLIDPVLLALAFGAILATFGFETFCLALAYFCLIYGAAFDWTGGAFLRYLWFASVAGFACALVKGRRALAGALLALATVMRIFPFAFLLGLVARTPRLPRPTRRVLMGFAAAALALGVATLAVPHGLRAWALFRENMSGHLRSVSPNMVGTTALLSYQSAPEFVDREGMRRIEQHRTRTYHLQLAFLLVPALLLLVKVAPLEDELGAAALGVIPLFFGLNLASYYYALLVLLLLAWRERPGWLAALFALELFTYAVADPKDALVYLYRDALLGTLLVAFSIEELRRARIARMRKTELAA
jgi:hypothetical protein